MIFLFWDFGIDLLLHYLHGFWCDAFFFFFSFSFPPYSSEKFLSRMGFFSREFVWYISQNSNVKMWDPSLCILIVWYVTFSGGPLNILLSNFLFFLDISINKTAHLLQQTSIAYLANYVKLCLKAGFILPP